MTLAEQLAASAARLKPKGGASRTASVAEPPQKPESEMTLAEQLAASASRLKPAVKKDAPPKPESEMTLAEQLQASAS